MKEQDDEPPPTPLVNVSGNYEYLTEEYYRCQDAELAGAALSSPSCADALDAYIVPVALEKAAMAGLPVPDWFLTNEYFQPPAVVDAVNPFSRRFAVVRTEVECATAAKQLSWNFKYTFCVQRIHEATELVEVRMVAGRTERPDYADWASLVYAVFSVPVAAVRLLRTGPVLQFSAIGMLPWRTLTAQERRWADDLVRRMRG
ncbi:MAG: hypothetical protein AB1792_01700 [Candidatus Zixiibacteriota bacterium]